MQEVFISYSRKDKAFVERLSSALEQKGRHAWVDWNDIDYAEDWWQKIQSGIVSSDNFLAIISPHSVRSKVCFDEVQYAEENQKRIIPVVIQDINELADRERAHPALKRHNWIFFRPEDDFDAAFGVLLETVDCNPKHVRMHTRLLVNAQEWGENNRNHSLLLRGDSLRQARVWLQTAADESPKPTALHREYIAASLQSETTRLRRTWSAALAGISIIMVLAVSGWRSARNQESLNTTDEALNAYDKGDIFKALSLTVSANRIDDPPSKSIDALKTIAGSPGPVAIFNSDIPVSDVAFSPDATRIIAGYDDGSLRLWDATSGVGIYDRPLYITPEQEHHVEAANTVEIGPDGRYVVSAACGGRDHSDGREGEEACSSVVVLLWEIEGDRLVLRHRTDDSSGVHEFRGTNAKVLKGDVYDVSFNPQLKDGEFPEIALALEHANGPVVLTYYSFDDNSEGLWVSEWWRDGSGPSVTSVAFWGGEIVAGYEDGYLRYWQGANTNPNSISGFRDRVTDLALSPGDFSIGSRPLVGASLDGTVRKTLAANNPDPDSRTISLDKPVNAISYRRDGVYALAAVADNLKLIDPIKGTVTATLRWQSNVAFSDVDFAEASPDGSPANAISGSADGTVILWDINDTDRPEDTQVLLDWLSKYRLTDLPE